MLKSKLNQNSIYFIKTYSHTEDILEIEIPVVPTGVQFSYTANFASHNILGRVTPLYQYIGGSGETLGFTVEIHEDVHVPKGKTLEEFIDDIKSLSYPYIKKDGGIEYFPQVKFFLGELEADVIVETSIVWQKPFRDGRYIRATINFELKVIEYMEKVEASEIVETIETLDGDYIYVDSNKYVYTAEQKVYVQTLKLKDRYGLSFTGIEIREYSPIYDTKIWDRTINSLNITYKELERKFKDSGEFGSHEKKWFKNMSELTAITNTAQLTGTSFGSYRDLEAHVKTLKTQYRKLLDDYYDKVSGVDGEQLIIMSEIEAMIVEFNANLDTLLLVAKEVLGNGSNK